MNIHVFEVTPLLAPYVRFSGWETVKPGFYLGVGSQVFWGGSTLKEAKETARNMLESLACAA